MDYGFIIDTKQYSGNFEREMCAFLTGHSSNCGTGKQEAKEYLETYKKIAGIRYKQGEYGPRPVDIFFTPNIWNNGMGFDFVEGEEELALYEYKKEMIDYKEEQMRRIESYRGQNISSWTDENINKAIKRYQKEIDETKKEMEVQKHPAYQSIRIHFEHMPSKDTITFLKQRAYEFIEVHDEKLDIIGFRVQKGENTYNV